MLLKVWLKLTATSGVRGAEQTLRAGKKLVIIGAWAYRVPVRKTSGVMRRAAKLYPPKKFGRHQAYKVAA
ncbi:hypothetical protein BXP70_00330 [Hymenobacter crusticola]|uniref:Uncharacterized protein n=1 Tax=Hymenobacter crusticola TaxID=1770526 RepID=A0A243WJI8_9BACT|nr:hypothetical protein BXP70_00330 [Hymenobacter crusticola]